MLDLDQILIRMVEATKVGEKSLLTYFGRVLKVDKKFKAGLVTQADKESEEVIKNYLGASNFQFNFLGEESFQSGDLQYLESEEPCWILDPLDGTTNFVHGFPVFAISLALYYQRQVQVGLVYAPLMGGGEMYTAIRGQGAKLNNEKITCSQQIDLGESLLATGFFPEDQEQLREQLPIFEKLICESRAIRRAGAAAYDLALVARGTFDAFWERGLKPWDTAAGSLLVEEAGGNSTTYRGVQFNPKLNSIIAGNKNLVSQLQKLIQGHLNASTN